MAKFSKKKITGKQITKEREAIKYAKSHNVELDQSNYLSAKAMLEWSADGDYKGKLSGIDIARAYMTQRTPKEFARDFMAAQKLTKNSLTEKEFIANVRAHDDRIEQEIERIRAKNRYMTSSELTRLIAVQVFGSE